MHGLSTLCNLSIYLYVPDDAMLEYFRDLLGQQPPSTSSESGEDSTADIGAAPPAADGSDLNVPITVELVVEGIKSLHKSK